MHCSQCGNRLEDGARFCNKCGNPVELLNKTVSAVTQEKPSKTKAIITGTVSILSFIIAFGVVRYLTQESVNTVTGSQTPSRQEIINQSVQEVRNSTVFPSQLDEVTTWTGITGTTNSIRYQYTLHDIDEAQVNNTVLKDILAPAVCQNADTKYILDSDINMEYSYAVAGSAKTFFVSISKIDCL